MKNNDLTALVALALSASAIQGSAGAFADGTEASFLQAFRSLHSTDIAGMGEDWFQGVLPFDLDGDGDEDCIAYDTNGDDCSWLFHERTDNGWNLSRPNAGGKHDIDRIARLDARQYSFFEFSTSDDPARLLCIEYHRTRYPSADNPAFCTNIASFLLLPGGVHEIRLWTNGLSSLVDAPSFVGLQRVLPTEYRGTNLVVSETSWTACGYTNLPPSSLKTSLSLAAEERTRLLSALAAEGTTNAATCIVCDADGDGDTDAYLSIRGGLMATNSSDWTLWLQSSNEWTRAEVPMHNKGLGPFLDPDHPGRFLPSFDDDVRSVLPSVHASESDFYRVYRPDGTTWPAVFPRAPDGTLPEEFHRLFEVGAAFMRLERILPEPLVRPEGGNANALE